MQQSSLSATFTSQTQFWACVDQQGQIIASDITGNRIIGVSLERFKQMETAASEALSKAENYYAMLEEHGLIIKPKTPEEQISELTEQVKQLTALVTSQITKGEQKHESERNTVDGRQFIAAKQPVASKNIASKTDS